MIFIPNRQHGFTLVEALVVSAISVMVFGALMATFQYSLELLANSRAKTTALSIANDRMEYFRSLPYDNVGTIAGIPSGTIPQHSSNVVNNTLFTERVLVEYVDDPADGLLTATTTDSNGIPADYKRVKIEVSWTIKEVTSTISLVSNIVPRSIETTAGGGTVRVNVLDANSSPLSGALVTLINNTTASPINVTRSTDLSGSALFSGAPAASNYEVIVTAPGYSTDQTYAATTSNPNPITAPFSVLEADISTVTFQIGELSDIDITTYSSIVDSEFIETFTNTAGIATSTGANIVGGKLELQGSPGSYAASGQIFLAPIAPTSIERWEAVTVAASLPNNTEYIAQVFTVSSSTYTLISDSVLPNNSSGMTGPVIDISSLDAGIYPSIVIGLIISSTDNDVTPSLDELAVYFRESETVRTGVALSTHGNKVIGSNLAANPIYKTTLSGSTDGAGELGFTDVEFDTYNFTLPSGLVVSRTCPALPLVHHAGIDSRVEIVLVNKPTHSLRVTVLSNTGKAIPGASVTLRRTGFNNTVNTNACGQSFISSGVTAESDYEVVVAKPGFATVTMNSYNISGNGDVIVMLNPS